MQVFLFPLGIFLSAGLLFVIQPMVAKVLLPVYGGTPAVWTVCMLFFQVLLLMAYGYAWCLSKLQGRYAWRLVHLAVCLFSVWFVPFVVSPQAPGAWPEVSILKTLLFQLGLPLLVIGASAPLLQYAFSQTTGKDGRDPYYLYAASNAGSLLALMSYPWLIERFSKVSQQFYGWQVLYGVYLILIAALLCFIHYRTPDSSKSMPIPPIPWKMKVTWLFLSFIPCSLMLGVTFYITTDVAAVPLLWVLPLALYLLSFVVTFAAKPWVSHDWVVRNTLLILAFPALFFILGTYQIALWQLLSAHLLGFFAVSLLCHGELARLRPPPFQLTTFYFCLASGGVLAGFFNGVVAPKLFSYAYEYPLVFLLALLAVPFRKKGWDWRTPLWVFLILAIGLLGAQYPVIHWIKSYHGFKIAALMVVFIGHRSKSGLCLGMTLLLSYVFLPWFKSDPILTAQRNFYGVKQVFARADTHALMSQSTLHGFQIYDAHQNDGTRAYYGPVSEVTQYFQRTSPVLHAMIMGLGTGMMVCQFRSMDQVDVVEIDRQVIDIANHADWFTYLRDCPAKLTLIESDGRVAALKAKDAWYELLVLDAFNSDAIPVHLLTREAFETYQKKMHPQGVILVNISNRHLQVLPVLTAVGRSLGMLVLNKVQAGEADLGRLSSEWALLTHNEPLAARLMSEHHWRFVADAKEVLWTDDYSNLVSVLKIMG